MDRLHLINPAAGKHNPFELVSGKLNGEPYYLTAGVGDAERYIREYCSDKPETHIMVYGGDGTLNEVVNGVIGAGAGKSAHISIVPTGTGNDFSRCLEPGRTYRADVMRCNGKYAVNIINTGFDSTVVAKTATLKRIPLITGSGAYILGVIDTLIKKLGEDWKITLVNPDGSVTESEDEYLLALVANGQYYGGGFKAAPLSKLDDGMLDVLFVKKISRVRFIKLVGDYRTGAHIDHETGSPIARFADIMTYRRCRAVTIEGLRTVCVDGEVSPCESLEVEVVPDAVTIVS